MAGAVGEGAGGFEFEAVHVAAVGAAARDGDSLAAVKGEFGGDDFVVFAAAGAGEDLVSDIVRDV